MRLIAVTIFDRLRQLASYNNKLGASEHEHIAGLDRMGYIRCHPNLMHTICE